MEILYILVPSVAIPLAIALLFFFICVCRNNQKSSSPPVQRQPKHVRGQNVEMSMLNAYKPKVKWAERGSIYDVSLGLKQTYNPPQFRSQMMQTQVYECWGSFAGSHASLTSSEAAWAFFPQCVHFSAGPHRCLPTKFGWEGILRRSSLPAPQDSAVLKISKKEIPCSSNQTERDEER